MFEVEQKFSLRDLHAVEQQLLQLGAIAGAMEHHVDTYFNHPCRDFAATSEALRIRRINGKPLITYKGPKDPGPVKVREELEWALDPGDGDGSSTANLLTLLGFRKVADVEKSRRPYSFSPTAAGPPSGLLVTLDEVKNLGFFAEIEAVIPARDQLPETTAQIIQLAERLGLRELEPKSYLTLVLESAS
jgi:adenylate cyclase class 2